MSPKITGCAGQKSRSPLTDGRDRGGLFPGEYDFDISSGGEDDDSYWVRVAGNGETIGI
ncbi:hypothetical protein LSP04_10500 [Levilactobacillus spicheri]|uniref:Uncharacterized protein n=1 Tax=Levilactobacillus spicheri TaxID=216463 RepID=A0ABQ0WNJ0_9LACO|nr:hypothetical protein LSP04_10500 [Levilactobacillus spicheri]